MTDREAIVILIDALLRKGTEQDGNWGYPSFHAELRDLQQRYGSPPGQTPNVTVTYSEQAKAELERVRRSGDEGSR